MIVYLPLNAKNAFNVVLAVLGIFIKKTINQISPPPVRCSNNLEPV